MPEKEYVPSKLPEDAAEILENVREERKGSPPKTDKNGYERHGFFKFMMSLNLLADAGMCLYSAYRSSAPVITVGMTVLALCFLIVVPGLILLRLTLRKSSAAIAALAYTAVDLLIGFVFACEFFDMLPETAALAEGMAIGVMVLLVIIFVNILVKRMVDKNM